MELERSVTELSFRVAKLRLRLRLVKNRCWSNLNDSLDSSLSSIDSDSSSFSSPPLPPLNTSTPMRRCPNLSDHSVNANEEFDSFFSSPTRTSTSSEEIPKLEVTEDVSSTHSMVEINHKSQNRLEEHSPSPQDAIPTLFSDETATLPLNVHLPPRKPPRTFCTHLAPPPPVPPRKVNSHLPPKLPPKLKKRTRLFENLVF